MSLVLLSLVLPSLWVTPVKISISGLMYVTGVTVTGVTFLMGRSVYRVLCIPLVIHSVTNVTVLCYCTVFSVTLNK